MLSILEPVPGFAKKKQAARESRISVSRKRNQAPRYHLNQCPFRRQWPGLLGRCRVATTLPTTCRPECHVPIGTQSPRASRSGSRFRRRAGADTLPNASTGPSRLTSERGKEVLRRWIFLVITQPALEGSKRTRWIAHAQELQSEIAMQTCVSRSQGNCSTVVARRLLVSPLLLQRIRQVVERVVRGRMQLRRTSPAFDRLQRPSPLQSSLETGECLVKSFQCQQRCN